MLVPLRGRRKPLGVLQAFSTTTWAFTDHDVRCFDLFAELVLSALKPEDQDRRINWLSDVAGEVLQTKPAAAAPVVAAAAIETPQVEPTKAAVETGLAPSPVSATTAPAAAPATTKAPPAALPELAVLTQPVVIPAASVELPDLGVEDKLEDEAADELFDIEKPATPTEPDVIPFPQHLSLPGGSRPGLNVVMGLVAVAALFSAGAWWGMQFHEKTASTKIVAAKTATSPQPVTAPAADVPSPDASDNLMSIENRFRSRATYGR